MKKRIKLEDRILPAYTKGEERVNMISHIVGGALGVIALVLCTTKAVIHHNTWGVVSAVIYGLSLICL